MLHHLDIIHFHTTDIVHGCMVITHITCGIVHTGDGILHIHIMDIQTGITTDTVVIITIIITTIQTTMVTDHQEEIQTAVMDVHQEIRDTMNMLDLQDVVIKQ